ncbi:MAG: PqqD family protein [bacterium]|nr:PqqD family protein [bacterium]
MEVNLLDLIPEQKIKFEESGDGLITLIKPKFKNKFLVKYLLPRIKKPNFKIKLDQFGSFVWKQCDGNNTVGQIANLLKAKFQDEIDPVHDRLAVFIQSLARNHFIEYKNYES